MSDTSQGEGWWQASDGKWYAPEQHPDVQQPDVQQPTQPVDEAGPPTEWGRPGAPPGGSPGAPPGTSNNKKWIIPVAVGAALIIGVIAFLLLRGGDDDNNVATKTDSTDQSTDKTDSTK